MRQPGVPRGQRQCELREDLSVVSIARAPRPGAYIPHPGLPGGLGQIQRFLEEDTVRSKERWKAGSWESGFSELPFPFGGRI